MKSLVYPTLLALCVAACGSGNATTKEDAVEEKTEKQTTEEKAKGDSPEQAPNVATLIEMFDVLTSERRPTPDYYADDARFQKMYSVLQPEPFGLEEANASDEKFLAMSSDIQARPLRITDLGDGTYLAEVYTTGTFDGKMGDMAPTGDRFGTTTLQVYSFDEDGKIKELKVWQNEMEMMIQLGQMPHPMGNEVVIRDMPSSEPIVQKVDETPNARAIAAVETLRKMERKQPADEAAMSAMIDDDVVFGLPPRPDMSKATWMKNWKMFSSALTFQEPEVHETWTVGDLVIRKETGRAKHTGKLGKIEATDESIENPWVAFYRFEDGKLVDATSYSNPLYVMKQLGAFPPTKGATGEAKATK